MQKKQCDSLLFKKQQYVRPVVDVFKFQNIDIVRTSDGNMGWGSDWGDWTPEKDFT